MATEVVDEKDVYIIIHYSALSTFYVSSVLSTCSVSILCHYIVKSLYLVWLTHALSMFCLCFVCLMHLVYSVLTAPQNDQE